MNALSIILGFTIGCLATLLSTKAYGRHLAKKVDELSLNSNRSIELRINLPGAQDLASSINKKNRNYQSALRKKEQENNDLLRGLSELSHDIKTPLAGAKGHIQLALSRERTNKLRIKSEERADHLKSAIARIDAANSILDNLTSYTRACDPDRELELQSIKILPVLLNVLDGYEPLFLDKKWTPVLAIKDENAETKANEQALRRIFDNLISNALRYGESAPKLTLKHSEFTLSNNVCNPDSIDSELIFKRFHRSNSSQTATGSGLGLPTARRLAIKMKMHLEAKVEASTITFTLRFQQNDATKESDSCPKTVE